MTKKKFLTELLIFVIVMSLALLSACNLKDLGKPDSQEGEKSVTIIIGDETFEVQSSAEYVHEILLTLAEEKGFDYTFYEGGYGVSVTRLKELRTTSDWTSWVSIYHDIDDVTLIDIYGTYSYKGNDYFMSLVSVDKLPVFDNHTYVFVQEQIA